MARPHVPSTAEWAAMSWHARAKLIGLKARRRRDGTGYEGSPEQVLAEAQRLLDAMPADEPVHVEARRQVLKSANYDLPFKGWRRSNGRAA